MPPTTRPRDGARAKAERESGFEYRSVASCRSNGKNRQLPAPLRRIGRSPNVPSPDRYQARSKLCIAGPLP